MSFLDNNLLAQLVVVLISASVFIFVLEGFGYITIKIIKFIFSFKNTDELKIELIPRIFIGGLAYTLVFLLIGSLGLISGRVVLSISLILPILYFIIFKRWALLNRKEVFKDYKYVVFGSFVFLLITFILWFRPETNFDALWYQITIPKLFLINHNTANQGGLVRYSLQPTITYFWNLFTFSLPVSTALASIINNAINVFILLLSAIYVTILSSKLWNWNKFQQFVLPILICGSYMGLTQFGNGGNDLIGTAYCLVATMYVFNIIKNMTVAWFEYLCGLLLIVGVASIKIFFSIFAALLFVYLIIETWDKLPKNKKLFKLSLTTLIIFIITYLPWIIRSYFYTGRLLDPIGTPGLNQSVYVYQGGGSFLIHWTVYIFDSFYNSIWPILTFIYSPLVLVGVLSIFNKNLKGKISSLWVLGVFGLFTVFFASIALQWRYYLPEATLLIFIGNIALIHFAKEIDRFSKIIIWGFLIALVPISIARAIMKIPDITNEPTINQKIYVRHFTNINDYINQKTSSSVYDYNQQISPTDLKSNDKILVANTYVAGDSTAGIYKGIHNLAYVNNPFVEPSMNKISFNYIHSSSQLMSYLKNNNIDYVLTRNLSMNDFCKESHIQDAKKCSILFTAVLKDSNWNVTWYKIAKD